MAQSVEPDVAPDPGDIALLSPDAEVAKAERLTDLVEELRGGSAGCGGRGRGGRGRGGAEVGHPQMLGRMRVLEQHEKTRSGAGRWASIPAYSQEDRRVDCRGDGPARVVGPDDSPQTGKRPQSLEWPSSTTVPLLEWPLDDSPTSEAAGLLTTIPPSGAAGLLTTVPPSERPGDDSLPLS
jgi:hypothetical protein